MKLFPSPSNLKQTCMNIFLRSSDSKLIFKGYLAVYEETLNENGNGNDEHNGVPTDLEQGQKQRPPKDQSQPTLHSNHLHVSPKPL